MVNNAGVENKFNNGKVYKLVNTVDDSIYIGSTCLKLSQRKNNHKSLAKTKTCYKVYEHLNMIGWDNVRIILLENVNAENSAELRIREQYYIDLLQPDLNQLAAYVPDCPHGRTHEKCKDCHGTSICQHLKQKYQCVDCNGDANRCYDCGHNYCSRFKLLEHYQTQKHIQNFIFS